MRSPIIILIMLLALLQPSQLTRSQPDNTRPVLAFVSGVADDPFYITLASGVAQAAADLGVESLILHPEALDPAVQIPLLETLISENTVDYLIVAPADSQALIPVLERAHLAGIEVITVDTFIGDGDYRDGQITFPLTYIGSDNFTGGFTACKVLADHLGEGASIYIQNVRPGISTTDQREAGCQAAALAFGLEVVGITYNDNQVTTAQEQTAAALTANPDIAGIFSTNIFGAEGAGLAVKAAQLEGAVKVVSFDATAEVVDLLNDGIITDTFAQQPYDMGYLAAALAVAHAHGYESIPRRIATGHTWINRDNLNEPAIQRAIYSATPLELEPPLHDLTIAFVPGVSHDPFFVTMLNGVEEAASAFGIILVSAEPHHFSPPAQIPTIEALMNEHAIDYFITAPTDRNEMIPLLEEISESGIPIITVDTFIGDGDYENGAVTFPLTYIGSDNYLGGYLGCSQLAMADMLGTGAKIYVQNVRPGISTTDQREEGCLAAAEDFALEVAQVDYTDNDVEVARERTLEVLAANPDIVGIFGTNVFSAQGAGAAVQEAGLGGVVEVIAYDATEFAIRLLREGTVTQVIAQKPGDMGYFAVLCAVAHARGVTSIPSRWATGYEVINRDNVDDPEIARFIYREE